MDIWNILKNVGEGLFADLVPGGNLILQGVNAFLDDGDKLDDTATASDVRRAVDNLPPEKQAELRMKEFDITLEQLRQVGESNRTMLSVELQSKRSTRPFIAKWSFIFVALFSGFVGLVIMSAYFYAVYQRDIELVKAIVDGWPFVLAILSAVTGTFSLLLRSYFGILAKEQESKLTALTGRQRQNGISQLLSVIKK